MKTDAEIAESLQGLAASSPGIEELTVDGVRAKRDKTALDFHERRAARSKIPTTRPIVSTIDLSQS